MSQRRHRNWADQPEIHSDGVLETRVTSLEQDIGDIKYSLQQLNSSLSNIGKTNWPTIFMAAAVAVSIIAYMGNLTLEPIRQNNNYLMTNVVARTEHQEKWRANDKAFDDIRDRINEARLAAKVDASNTQTQIDELKRALGGIYGARDAMQELQQRLQRLEDRREDRRDDRRPALPESR